MTDEQFIMLVERYLQGTASEAERKALASLVAEDTRLAESFREQARLNVRLRAALGEESEADARKKAKLVVASLSEEKSRETVRIVTDRVNGADSRPRRRILWWVAAAACLTVVVGSLGYNEYRRRTSAATLVAHIESVSKNVNILRRGRTVVATVGMEIILGDRIETGRHANLGFRYEGEDTAVWAGGDTTMRIESSASLFLRVLFMV
jgi:hypothetical protein